jgi:hypothetical protein
MNLSLSQSDTVALCEKRGVGISAIEELPGGGVRLVCTSTSGADLMRAKSKSQIMSGDPRRTAHRPTRPLW